MTTTLSFPAKRNDDLFVAAAKDDLAIFDSFDPNLINLRADLEAEHLTFRHRFTVDDGKTRRAIERNGADEECPRRNFALVRSA